MVTRKLAESKLVSGCNQREAGEGEEQIRFLMVRNLSLHPKQSQVKAWSCRGEWMKCCFRYVFNFLFFGLLLFEVWSLKFEDYVFRFPGSRFLLMHSFVLGYKTSRVFLYLVWAFFFYWNIYWLDGGCSQYFIRIRYF